MGEVATESFAPAPKRRHLAPHLVAGIWLTMVTLLLYQQPWILTIGRSPTSQEMETILPYIILALITTFIITALGDKLARATEGTRRSGRRQNPF